MMDILLVGKVKPASTGLLYCFFPKVAEGETNRHCLCSLYREMQIKPTVHLKFLFTAQRGNRVFARREFGRNKSTEHRQRYAEHDEQQRVQRIEHGYAGQIRH